MKTLKARKHLSAGSLLASVRKRLEKIKDPLLDKTNYPLTDCLMSALAMFGLKYRSLLQFEEHYLGNKQIRHNLKTLYGVEQVPSDTYMRERLDEVEPGQLRSAFKACLSAIQRGKQLPLFEFLDGHYLVSSDGTGFFHSNSIHCDNCCEKSHKDGSKSYYHQMMCAVIVHPSQSIVLPLMLEPILKQDGGTKNDCERNSSKRLLSTLRRMHPQLKMMIVEDALHSNGPHIETLESLDYTYIIGIKPEGNKALFDWVKGSACPSRTVHREGYTYELSWMNNVPLNDSHPDILVNFFECIETSPKGKKQRFTWVTNFVITEETIYELMRGARSRWKIENETFNTLKTQGYHFEHNFGHGYKNLSSIMGYLMMLAFLVDQIQQLCCPQFQAALKKCKRRIRLWEKMRNWFLTFFIDSWETFFLAIATPPELALGVGGIDSG
ncbi:transposase [Flagellimonas marinaquae]